MADKKKAPARNAPTHQLSPVTGNVKYLGVAGNKWDPTSFLSGVCDTSLAAAEEALEAYEEATCEAQDTAEVTVYHIVGFTPYDVEAPVQAVLTARKTVTY